MEVVVSSEKDDLRMGGVLLSVEEWVMEKEKLKLRLEGMRKLDLVEVEERNVIVGFGGVRVKKVVVEVPIFVSGFVLLVLEEEELSVVE